MSKNNQKQIENENDYIIFFLLQYEFLHYTIPLHL